MNPRLLKAAKAAMAQAYAPYSKFQVGAAILASNGKIYSGCNVENAAYPQGSCAEAGAIAAMVRAGGRRIREIAVIGGRKGKPGGPCMPCGGCRQRIREFADSKTRIRIYGAKGLHGTYSCDDLLPESFGPEHLK
jgi:cytidine deaminase